MRPQIARHLANLLLTTVDTSQAAVLERSRAQVAAPKISVPREFTAHDYAVYLLHIAAEIEHTLMVQYLYAAYSLGGPHVPSDKREQVLKWQRIILGIAREEMGHLLTVQNVLRLIGGQLNLDRQDVPWDIPFYPYPFALEKLTRKSLGKYVFAEAPTDWPPDVTPEERKEIEEAVDDKGAKPHRVGELYAAMIGLLSDRDLLPDFLFREETYPFQSSWDEWGRGYNGIQRGAVPGNPSPNVILSRLASRGDAVAALQRVAEQGEAPSEDPGGLELSHFRRFLNVLREFPQPSENWAPTWEAPTNPQAPGFVQSLGDGAGPVITNEEAGLWATVFNIRYRILLTYVAHSFRVSAETMESGASNPRSMIVNGAFGEMYQIRAISGILMQSPLGGESKPERAGPPFQVPYTVSLPLDDADCWRRHVDLIDASDGLLNDLSIRKSPHARYAATLRSADRQRRSELEVVLNSCRRGYSAPSHPRSIAL
jgi:Ferritin-like